MLCPKCGGENRGGDKYCAVCGEEIPDGTKEKNKFQVHIRIRFWPLVVSIALIFVVIRCLPATCLGELCTKRDLFQIARNGAGGLLCSVLIFAALLQFVVMFLCGFFALLASVFDEESSKKTLMIAGAVTTISAIFYVSCIAIANYAWSGGFWIIRPNLNGFILTGLGIYLSCLGWEC